MRVRPLCLDLGLSFFFSFFLPLSLCMYGHMYACVHVNVWMYVEIHRWRDNDSLLLTVISSVTFTTSFESEWRYFIVYLVCIKAGKVMWEKGHIYTYTYAHIHVCTHSLSLSFFLFFFLSLSASQAPMHHSSAPVYLWHHVSPVEGLLIRREHAEELGV